MELIYNIIDYSITASPVKRFFVILGISSVLIPTIAAAYLFFRTYSLVGLGIISIIVLLVSFDSVLERTEMTKLKQQDQSQTVERTSV